MPYATIEDIKAILPEDELVRLTDDEGLGIVDTGRVDKAIARADADIDSYCGMRYSVPVSPAPEVLRNISAELAVYEIYSRSAMELPPLREARYMAALQQLEDIAKGSVSLGPAHETAWDTSGAATNKRTDTNVFRRSRMGGF